MNEAPIQRLKKMGFSESKSAYLANVFDLLILGKIIGKSSERFGESERRQLFEALARNDREQAVALLKRHYGEAELQKRVESESADFLDVFLKRISP